MLGLVGRFAEAMLCQYKTSAQEQAVIVVKISVHQRRQPWIFKGAPIVNIHGRISRGAICNSASISNADTIRQIIDDCFQSGVVANSIGTIAADHPDLY